MSTKDMVNGELFEKVFLAVMKATREDTDDFTNPEKVDDPNRCSITKALDEFSVEQLVAAADGMEKISQMLRESAKDRWIRSMKAKIIESLESQREVGQ